MVLSGSITFGNLYFTSVYFEIHSMHCNIDNIGKKAENLEHIWNYGVKKILKPKIIAWYTILKEIFLIMEKDMW